MSPGGFQLAYSPRLQRISEVRAARVPGGRCSAAWCLDIRCRPGRGCRFVGDVRGWPSGIGMGSGQVGPGLRPRHPPQWRLGRPQARRPPLQSVQKPLPERAVGGARRLPGRGSPQLALLLVRRRGRQIILWRPCALCRNIGARARMLNLSMRHCSTAFAVRAYVLR
jgi:hypothetical protein